MLPLYNPQRDPSRQHQIRTTFDPLFQSVQRVLTPSSHLQEIEQVSAHRLLTAVRRLTTSRSQPAPSLQASVRRLRSAEDPGCAVFAVTLEFVRPVAAELGVRGHDGIVGSSCDRVKAAHRKIDIDLKAWAGGI